MHSAKGQRCSCPAAHCNTPGKHPRIRDWPNIASSDPDTIRKWWKQWPESNIGMCTGSGTVVIDIDPIKGGDDSFTKLCQNQEPLPITPESVTGSGGRHILLSYDPNDQIPNAQSIAPGVDVRGDGGFIVAPPSVHASQRQYEWASGRSPYDVSMSPLPEWLNTLIRSKARVKWKQSVDEPILDGERHIVLTSIAGTMRIRGLDDDAILAALSVMNAKRCVPPMDEAELKIIATSMMKYRDEPWSGQIGTDGRPDAVNHLTTEGAPAAPPPVQRDNWEQELTYDKEGNVKQTLAGNAALFIANLPAWKGCLQFDAFNNRIDWMRTPPLVAGMEVPGGEFTDHHVTYVRQWFARHRGTEFKKDTMQDGIVSAARRNWVHPLQDYLKSLEWDGVPRLTRWMSTYLGAEHNDYVKSVGEWWMISAIARAMKPGCQVDHMLILEGRQGAGKSTAARILAGEWFLGSLPDLRGNAKEAADALNGHWIVEMGELDAMRGATLTKTKNFLSQPADTYRAAYARFKETHKRSCVFIGTTNEANYLRDSTGARRFWPVRVHQLDKLKLEKDRNQLWAEAKFMYDHGATWHPTPEMQEMLGKEQDCRFDTDPWEEIIETALLEFGDREAELKEAAEKGGPQFEPTPLTSAYIMDQWLEIKAAVLDRMHSNRLAAVMHRLGWELRPVRFKRPTNDNKERSVVMKVWVDKKIGYKNSDDVERT